MLASLISLGFFFFLFTLLTDFELSDIDGFGVYNLLEETEVKQTHHQIHDYKLGKLLQSGGWWGSGQEKVMET